MSLDATRWAWKQEVKPMAKLVLLSLADRAGDNNEFSASVADIASQTGIDRKTIMTAICNLQKYGFLTVLRFTGMTNVYRLRVK